jgi:tight adherence protein C
VFFIFPSLFLVTIGPAVITISESFKKYLNH